jgi:hypothetical protein
VEPDVADRLQGRLEQQQADRPRPVSWIGRERLPGEVGRDVQLLEVGALCRRIDLGLRQQAQYQPRRFDVGGQADAACFSEATLLRS